jgi:hypothetical protein
MQPPNHIPVVGGGNRPIGWEVALQFAQQCRDKFEESVKTVDDIERNSNAALELLAKR